MLPVSDIRLPGLHNRENVLAAVLAASLEGVPLPRIRASVRAFRGLEHRLERVRILRGVEYVNDSKATTVDAAIKAIESFDRPIVLILGGKDKGSDFAPLRRAVRGDVVLLAPACTSWDMFKSFEERGRAFKRGVRRLTGRSKRAAG